jgi:predicted N-acetyltransferase YhbS
MHHATLTTTNAPTIEELFSSTFTASEGEQEGHLIGQLAAKLSKDIDNQDILCFGTFERDALVGSIFFTKLLFDTEIVLYLLAPVAVDPHYQRKGIGSSLIAFGIEKLRSRSVDGVVTYGDLAFYSKVGFRNITENIIPAPFPLSIPQGWIGQSLQKKPLPIIKNRPTCVQAFNTPTYW